MARNTLRIMDSILKQQYAPAVKDDLFKGDVLFQKLKDGGIKISYTATAPLIKLYPTRTLAEEASR